VIEGLRYLPRLQAERERQIEDGTPVADAEAYLNCAECPLDHQQRRGYRCGWLPEGEWRDDARPFPDSSVCVGYSTSLPEVIEAARLLVWANRGALSSYLGKRRLSAVAADCVDVLDGEVKSVEREDMRKRREAVKRG
jgi:hypothetical protein